MSEEEAKEFSISIEHEEQLKSDFRDAGFSTREDIEELLTGFKWFLSHDEPIVPLSIFKERAAACHLCSKWKAAKTETDKSKCIECGCGPAKLINTSQMCPLKPPKWTKIKYLK